MHNTNDETPEIPPFVNLSWEEIERAVDSIVVRIAADGFVPDCIVGIAVGGLVPLGLIAKRLNAKNTLTITASSYDGRQQREIVVSNLPDAKLDGLKILLVDDIGDRGDTLRKVTRIFIERYRVGELKSATIAMNRGHCSYHPDYFGIAVNEWVNFPWEMAEAPPPLLYL